MENFDNNLEYYNGLIINYFNNSLSKEEGEALHVWLQKDKANKRYFDECREVMLSGKLTTAQKEFSSKDAFQRFKTKIDTVEKPNQENSDYRKLTISLARIAAIIAIAYLSGILSLSVFRKANSPLITFQEIIVPAGSKTKVQLPDGTVVWLNSESKLSYANNYNKDNREVKLEGEGYFKVAHDKKRPFIVQTSNISVLALGTEFNVKCYPKEGFIETTLVNGSVKIEGNSKENKENTGTTILKPNEKLTFIKKTGKLYLAIDSLQSPLNKANTAGNSDDMERKERMIIRKIDPEPYIAWKEDKLVFTGEKFEEIKEKLERWYGVSIQIKDPEILSYRFKGSFENETLEQALDALQLASHFSYSINKNKIIISK